MLATLLFILTEDEDVLDRLQRQIEEESSSDESDVNMDTSEPGPSQREQPTNGRGSERRVNRGRGRSRGRGGSGRGRGRRGRGWRGRGGRERGFGADRTEKRNIGKRTSTVTFIPSPIDVRPFIQQTGPSQQISCDPVELFSLYFAGNSS